MTAGASAAELPPEVELALSEAIRITRELLVRDPDGPGSVEVGSARQRADGDHDVVDPVAQALYARWFTRSSFGGDAVARGGGFGGRYLVEALRAAHADTSRWEGGWSAIRVSTAGRVVAAKAGRRRLLDPIDYLNPDRPGLPPPPGGPVIVPARRDSTSAQPGLWLTYGAGWPRASAPPELLRLYWNVDAGSAPALVHELTRRLNEVDVAYALKCPASSPLYDRADAVVAFVPRSSFPSLAPVLRRAHSALATDLGPEAPPLVKPLGRGLGLAEDPPEEESFGMSRCRLIVEALVGAAAEGSDADRALAAVSAHLRANGIPPERPYLSSFASPQYSW